jgi:riboflavin kinase, archaea type
MAGKRASSDSDRLHTLVQLMVLGGGHSYAQISSAKLGGALGLTQQAASRRMIDLERAGFIERAHSGRGLMVKLTDPGLDRVRAFYGELKTSFERLPNELVFRGQVFTGFREGRFYVSLKGYSKHFRATLGFVPFPGTLNLRLDSPAQIEQRRRLASLRGIEVPGFDDGKRTYGPVWCFRAKVEGKYPAAVLAIERTHYDNTVLEVISPTNLRKVLGLKDGDDCAVTAYLS